MLLASLLLFSFGPSQFSKASLVGAPKAKAHEPDGTINSAREAAGGGGTASDVPRGWLSNVAPRGSADLQSSSEETSRKQKRHVDPILQNFGF